MTEVDRVKLYRDLVFDENLKLKPYHDSVGKLTIGFGRNLEDRGITESEAILMLNNDIDDVVPELYRNWPWLHSHPEPVQRALANMAFNMGMSSLRSFKKMLAAVRAKEYETAADEVLDSLYATQVGDRAHRVADLIRMA